MDVNDISAINNLHSDFIQLLCLEVNKRFLAIFLLYNAMYFVRYKEKT